MPPTNLELADSVAITFKIQKNNAKYKTVIHSRMDDLALCPVLQWTQLVNQILSYEGTMYNTPVCTVRSSGGLNKIASSQVLTRLQATEKAVGSACLGFGSKEIGTHSLCLGAAMEMYLTGVLVSTIMLIDRWSSNTFLLYIRKQVEQFLQHDVKQMLTFRLF